jgi:hypothetical protein
LDFGVYAITITRDDSFAVTGTGLTLSLASNNQVTVSNSVNTANATDNNGNWKITITHLPTGKSDTFVITWDGTNITNLIRPE